MQVEGRAPLVLRAAPPPGSQGQPSASDLRNEYAAGPFLAVLGPLVPTTLFADFTHQVLARDWLLQPLLPGVPARQVLPGCGPAQQRSYYRQLGEVTARLHGVRGQRFGPVSGPWHPTWSQEVEHRLHRRAEEYSAAGLDPADVHHLLAALALHRQVLDEVRTPHLLHGDLWVLNTLVEPRPRTGPGSGDQEEGPVITAVLDHDRASWGDPLADTALHAALQRVGTAADAFWDTYPRPGRDGATRVRALYAWALNVSGARLDIHRRGLQVRSIPAQHWDLGQVVQRLGA